MNLYRSQILDEVNLASFIEKGSPALFPTDTVPALASSPEFASQLWRIKQRPSNKPLILMGSSKESLFRHVQPFALNDAILMAKLYWPGPLTLVLPIIPSKIFSNLNKFSTDLGMRVPASAVARSLLLKTGPLATTSANLSGKEPSLNPEELSLEFPDVKLLGPLPWQIGSGLASTVISWKKPGLWNLLREGAFLPDQAFFG